MDLAALASNAGPGPVRTTSQAAKQPRSILKRKAGDEAQHADENLTSSEAVGNSRPSHKTRQRAKQPRSTPKRRKGDEAESEDDGLSNDETDVTFRPNQTTSQLAEQPQEERVPSPQRRPVAPTAQMPPNNSTLPTDVPAAQPGVDPRLLEARDFLSNNDPGDDLTVFHQITEFLWATVRTEANFRICDEISAMLHVHQSRMVRRSAGNGLAIPIEVDSIPREPRLAFAAPNHVPRHPFLWSHKYWIFQNDLARSASVPPPRRPNPRPFQLQGPDKKMITQPQCRERWNLLRTVQFDLLYMTYCLKRRETVGEGGQARDDIPEAGSPEETMLLDLSEEHLIDGLNGDWASISNVTEEMKVQHMDALGVDSSVFEGCKKPARTGFKPLSKAEQLKVTALAHRSLQTLSARDKKDYERLRGRLWYELLELEPLLKDFADEEASRTDRAKLGSRIKALCELARPLNAPDTTITPTEPRAKELLTFKIMKENVLSERSTVIDHTQNWAFASQLEDDRRNTRFFSVSKLLDPPTRRPPRQDSSSSSSDGQPPPAGGVLGFPPTPAEPPPCRPQIREENEDEPYRGDAVNRFKGRTSYDQSHTNDTEEDSHNDQGPYEVGSGMLIPPDVLGLDLSTDVPNDQEDAVDNEEAIPRKQLPRQQEEDQTVTLPRQQPIQHSIHVAIGGEVGQDISTPSGLDQRNPSPVMTSMTPMVRNPFERASVNEPPDPRAFPPQLPFVPAQGYPPKVAPPSQYDFSSKAQSPIHPASERRRDTPSDSLRSEEPSFDDMATTDLEASLRPVNQLPDFQTKSEAPSKRPAPTDLSSAVTKKARNHDMPVTETTTQPKENEPHDSNSTIQQRAPINARPPSPTRPPLSSSIALDYSAAAIEQETVVDPPSEQSKGERKRPAPIVPPYPRKKYFTEFSSSLGASNNLPPNSPLNPPANTLPPLNQLANPLPPPKQPANPPPPPPPAPPPKKPLTPAISKIAAATLSTPTFRSPRKAPAPPKDPETAIEEPQLTDEDLFAIGFPEHFGREAEDAERALRDATSTAGPPFQPTRNNLAPSPPSMTRSSLPVGLDMGRPPDAATEKAGGARENTDFRTEDYDSSTNYSSVTSGSRIVDTMQRGIDKYTAHINTPQTFTEDGDTNNDMNLYKTLTTARTEGRALSHAEVPFIESYTQQPNDEANYLHDSLHDADTNDEDERYGPLDPNIQIALAARDGRGDFLALDSMDDELDLQRAKTNEDDEDEVDDEDGDGGVMIVGEAWTRSERRGVSTRGRVSLGPEERDEEEGLETEVEVRNRAPVAKMVSQEPLQRGDGGGGGWAEGNGDGDGVGGTGDGDEVGGTGDGDGEADIDDLFEMRDEDQDQIDWSDD